jgi:hypothetical protein
MSTNQKSHVSQDDKGLGEKGSINEKSSNTFEKTYKVSDVEQKSSGVASLRLEPELATFLDTQGNEVGRCTMTWTGPGTASSTLTPLNGKPVALDVHFSKMENGNFQASGKLDGQGFSFITSSDNRLITNSLKKPIQIDAAAMALLKIVPGVLHNHVPNPPTVPLKEMKVKVGGSEPRPMEFDGPGCAVAIMAVWEAGVLTGGIGLIGAFALGWACHR